MGPEIPDRERFLAQCLGSRDSVLRVSAGYAIHNFSFAFLGFIYTVAKGIKANAFGRAALG